MRDIQAPDPSLGSAGLYWVLHLHAQEYGLTSKTGEMDTSLSLDLPRHIPVLGLLLSLKSSLSPDSFLVPEDYTTAAREFHEAAKTEGLGVLGAVLYSIRHTGASSDMGEKLRDLASIKSGGVGGPT